MDALTAAGVLLPLRGFLARSLVGYTQNKTRRVSRDPPHKQDGEREVKHEAKYVDCDKSSGAKTKDDRVTKRNARD